MHLSLKGGHSTGHVPHKDLPVGCLFNEPVFRPHLHFFVRLHSHNSSSFSVKSLFVTGNWPVRISFL